mgnify:CR=1 FL=1
MLASFLQHLLDVDAAFALVIEAPIAGLRMNEVPADMLRLRAFVVLSTSARPIPRVMNRLVHAPVERLQPTALPDVQNRKCGRFARSGHWRASHFAHCFSQFEHGLLPAEHSALNGIACKTVLPHHIETHVRPRCSG